MCSTRSDRSFTATVITSAPARGPVDCVVVAETEPDAAEKKAGPKLRGDKREAKPEPEVCEYVREEGTAAVDSVAGSG